MSTKLKPLQIRQNLLNLNKRIFSIQEFQRLFEVSPHVAKHFLEKYSQEDLFQRLKNGLYVLATDPPHQEEVANALYKPSYISFEYALAYWGIIPEASYQITSATTKTTRLFDTPLGVYSYLKIKRQAYTGYSLVSTPNKNILIADPEKALVDYLYFQSLGKKPVNDRIVWNKLKQNKLLTYAKLFERKSLTKLIKGAHA